MPTSSITTSGIETDDVGVISGDVDVTTIVKDGSAVVTVAYSGADEHYTVTGSPLRTALDALGAHAQVVDALRVNPGRDAVGNARSVNVSSLAL